MRVFSVVLALWLVGAAAAQDKDCKRPEMSGKQLRVWVQRSKTPEERSEVVCYLRAQATRFDRLAREQDAELSYALEHNVGGSKFPSAADHARTYRAYYRDKAVKYTNMARYIEERASVEPHPS